MPSDDELLKRAVENARSRRKGPRWHGVAHIFLLGSTYSARLCERFGLDPDETVKP